MCSLFVAVQGITVWGAAGEKEKKMKKYKLTDGDMRTHNGYQWEIGEWKTIDKKGNTLCSDEVFHFYDHPVLSIIFNPIHGNIDNPRLWECEVEDIVAHDRLKGGCKKMRLTKELPIPRLTLQQKVEFGIWVSLEVYSEPSYVKWAADWLSGTNRAAEAARAAACAAEAAAWAAEAATRAAAWAAAWAAERTAARAATWAAEAAAWAADAAEAATRAAAWAADAAAWAAGEVKIDFIAIIKKIKK